MVTHTNPLFGKRVVVTRALHQADDLNALLVARGAIPLSYPCIAIESVDDTQAFDHALQTQTFDWVVFTSANAVYALSQRLDALQCPLLAHQIAAIGDKTAQTVEKFLARKPDLDAWDISSAGVYELLNPVLTADSRVLLPQSDLAEPTLRDGLRSVTPHVADFVVYRTVLGSGGVDVVTMLSKGEVDVLTLTSPSTLDNFFTRLATDGGQPDPLQRVVIACIGSFTAQRAQEAGLNVAVIPPRRNMSALVTALEDYFRKG